MRFATLLALFSFAGPAHLANPADRTAFRLWFTFLAESQFFRTPAELPPEISDCAALLRYSYRESLRRHDDSWRNSLGLHLLPSFPSVQNMQNPGVNLFRTGPDSFAQFADAKTLRRWNTRFLSRDLSNAEPGDILFFRQLSQHMPFHTMVWIGPSQIDRSPGPWLLYHSGPGGEIRRVAAHDMVIHPDPQWRPVPGNENFLGVYRWNIL